jgi:hypothetical protein
MSNGGSYTKELSDIESPYIILFFSAGSQQFRIPPQRADSISQPGKAEKTTGGRGPPVVRNIPKEFSVTVSI